jgi:ribosomal protein S27AE
MAKMTCPECGVEMTHHATKVVFPRNEAEEALFDEELGGVVLERHCCPGCGEGASSVVEP